MHRDEIKPFRGNVEAHLWLLALLARLPTPLDVLPPPFLRRDTPQPRHSINERLRSYLSSPRGLRLLDHVSNIVGYTAVGMVLWTPIIASLPEELWRPVGGGVPAALVIILAPVWLWQKWTRLLLKRAKV